MEGIDGMAGIRPPAVGRERAQPGPLTRAATRLDFRRSVRRAVLIDAAACGLVIL